MLLDYICDDCREHFEGLKGALESIGIKYEVDSSIVRGLDYYTKTVFEIISGDFTVCGGGRYDGLIEECGGDSTPGIGFGLGIERLLIRLDELGLEIPNTKTVDLYIAPLGDAAYSYARAAVYNLRKKGISTEYDLVGRGLRAQMKYADKIGAAYTIVLGENEVNSGECEIKDMKTGEKQTVKTDKIAEFFGKE